MKFTTLMGISVSLGTVSLIDSQSVKNNSRRYSSLIIQLHNIEYIIIFIAGFIQLLQCNQQQQIHFINVNNCSK